MEKKTGKTLLKGLRGIANYYKCGLPRATEISKNKDVPKYKMGNCWYFYAEEIDEVFKVKEHEPTE